VIWHNNCKKGLLSEKEEEEEEESEQTEKIQRKNKQVNTWEGACPVLGINTSATKGEAV